MDLTKHSKTKWLFGILGAVFLGAIGSGVWDLAIKPLFRFSGNFAINILTLGINKLQDNIYIEIAKGMAERTSHHVYYLVMVFYLFAAISVTFYFWEGYDRRKSRYNSEILKIIEDEEKSIESLKNEIGGYLDKAKKLMFVFTIVMTFFIILLVFDYSRTMFIDNKVRIFEQMYTIDAPYLTDQERLKIKSDFGLIKNKEDYERLITKLKDIAISNKIKL